MEKGWIRSGVTRIEVALQGSPFVDTTERELTVGQWVLGLESTIRKTVRAKRKKVELAFVHGEPLLFDGFLDLIWRLFDTDMVWSMRTMLPTEGFYELRANPTVADRCVGIECAYVSPTDLDRVWVIGSRDFTRRVVQLDRKRYPVSVTALNEVDLAWIMDGLTNFRLGRIGTTPIAGHVDTKILTYVPLEYGRKGEMPCQNVQWLIGPDGGFYPCFSEAVSKYDTRKRVGELGTEWGPPKELRMCRAKECFYGEEERVSNEAD